MAHDGKYGRVTTEFGDIGDDEPVIVFRAQDGLLPAVLDVYRELCERHGSPPHHLDLIAESRTRVVAWQGRVENRVKMPPTSDGMAEYDRIMRDGG